MLERRACTYIHICIYIYMSYMAIHLSVGVVAPLCGGRVDAALAAVHGVQHHHHTACTHEAPMWVRALSLLDPHVCVPFTDLRVHQAGVCLRTFGLVCGVCGLQCFDLLNGLHCIPIHRQQRPTSLLQRRQPGAPFPVIPEAVPATVVRLTKPS